MAINDVRLMGQVIGEPTLYRKRGNPMPHRAVLTIRTISRFLNSQERDKIVYDDIVIMTKSPDMIVEINQRIHAGDMVSIKGMLCTADVMRKFICGNDDCGEEYQDAGYTCYVHPIHIMKIKDAMAEDDANIYIHENAEVSNEVTLDGTVCSEVFFREERNYTYYKLGVRRSFHILEDNAEKRVDYPAINTYQAQAVRDHFCVHRGTRMNVRGAIRVRDVKRVIPCPYCGTEEERIYKVLEVVASNVNYTANWDSPPDSSAQAEEDEALEEEVKNEEAEI